MQSWNYQEYSFNEPWIKSNIKKKIWSLKEKWDEVKNEIPLSSLSLLFLIEKFIYIITSVHMRILMRVESSTDSISRRRKCRRGRLFFLNWFRVIVGLTTAETPHAFDLILIVVSSDLSILHLCPLHLSSEFRFVGCRYNLGL